VGKREEILALAQATVEVIKQLLLNSAMLAPMILQKFKLAVESEEEMAPQEAQPVFRKGGKFVGTIA
jgi:hypothetical protein